MKRLLGWIVGAPLALIALLVSIANRAPVTFSLDPFSLGEPAYAVDVPLFLLLFAALFGGLLIGWFVGWSGHLRKERQARRSRAAETLAADRGAVASAPGGGRALLPHR